MRKIFLIILLSACIFQGRAQSKSEMIEFLTNGASREWSYKNYVTTLGSDCSGEAQLFIFFANGSTQCNKCVAGKLTSQIFKWHIEDIAIGEYEIVFDHPIGLGQFRRMKRMRLDFILPEIKKPDVRMTWRNVPATKESDELIVEFRSVN